MLKHQLEPLSRQILTTCESNLTCVYQCSDFNLRCLNWKDLARVEGRPIGTRLTAVQRHAFQRRGVRKITWPFLFVGLLRVSSSAQAPRTRSHRNPMNLWGLGPWMSPNHIHVYDLIVHLAPKPINPPVCHGVSMGRNWLCFGRKL